MSVSWFARNVGALGIGVAVATLNWQADAQSGSAPAGRVALEQGDFAGARRLLTAAARTQRTPEAYFDIARVAFAEANHTRAERDCRALRRFGAHPLRLACDARAELAWGRGERAREMITALPSVSPHYEIWVALAMAERLRGDTAGAVSALEHARELRTDAWEVEADLLLVELSVEPPDARRRSLENILSRFRGHPRAQILLASLQTGSERLQTLVSANTTRPNWPEGLAALGRAQLEEGDAAAASVTLGSAVQLSPNEPGLRASLARTYLALQDGLEAEQEARAGLRAVPNHAACQLVLAEALVAQERFDEAFEQYRVAADADPNNADISVEAATLALTRNRDVLAAAFLDRALTQQPNHGRAHLLYGDVMRARRDATQARRHYEEAERLGQTEATDRLRQTR